VGRLGSGDVDAACVGFSAAPRVRRPSCPPPLVSAAPSCGGRAGSSGVDAGAYLLGRTVSRRRESN